MHWKYVARENIKQMLFVCGAFVLMVLIGCLSVSSVIQQEVKASVAIGLNETEKTIKSYLREPKIAFNNTYLAVQDMLDREESQEAVYKYLTRITYTMHTQEEGVRGFLGIYGYIRGEFIDSVGLNPDKSYIPQQRPWYQVAIRNKKAEYTAPYVDARTGKIVISLAREVYGKRGDYYGVLSMDVDIAWMLSYAKSLQFAEGGYGMIVNQYLYIIAHPDENVINLPLQNLSKGYSHIAELLRLGKEISAEHVADHENKNAIVFFRELYNGWHVGVVMPVRSYYTNLYRTALSLMALGLVLSAALSFLLLRLSAAKMRSDEENRSKSSFLAMMSHEIRTPLNAIIGLSEVQLLKSIPKETRTDIETIRDSGASLLAIINDILDFSKLEAGGFTLVPVNYDIPSLINDTMQLNIGRINLRPVAFTLQIDPELPARLFGDELRIKQILNNLLSNAFKYTKEGEVRLVVKWERQGGAAVLIFSVTDTGIGIKKADMDKLFIEYSRMDFYKNRKVEGTGLGLIIVKRLAEQMGGSIMVDSVYGKGSVFTVSVRQNIIDDSPIGKDVANNLMSLRFTATRRSRNKNISRVLMPHARVLVVDDVATNLDVARGVLLPYKMTVDCVLSGQEAVDRIKYGEVRYDAIFMDHMMPGMDGIEATQKIRTEINTEYARNIPIIALTANALAGNEEMFLSKGFNGFISKPVNLVALDNVLKKWVEARQPESALQRPPVVAAADNPDETAEKNASGANDDEWQIEGIDLIKALRNYEDNAEGYLMVLRSYVKHTPDLLEKLRTLTQSSLHEYAITIHGLKGSSWSIGAESLGEFAKQLELAAKAGDFATVAAKNSAFIAEAEILLARLREFLQTQHLENEGEKSVRDAVDKQTLTRMLAACKRFDVMAMENEIKILEQTAYSAPNDTALVAWLREQLDSLEYDILQKRLEEETAG